MDRLFRLIAIDHDGVPVFFCEGLYHPATVRARNSEQYAQVLAFCNRPYTEYTRYDKPPPLTQITSKGFLRRWLHHTLAAPTPHFAASSFFDLLLWQWKNTKGDPPMYKQGDEVTDVTMRIRVHLPVMDSDESLSPEVYDRKRDECAKARADVLYPVVLDMLGVNL